MLDKHSKKYGKVFLRGRVFHFTPEIINDQFGLENIVQEGVCDDFGEIVRKITGEKLKKWPKRLKASRLTSFYSVLHKIAISNWLPSKNTTVVTAEQATLLYKIGCGVRFNFGQLVFDQIGRMAERLSSGLLPFPSLIYQILVTQGFKSNKEDIFIKLPELFVITRVLLIGDRVVDLPWVNEEIHAGDESPADDVAEDVADLSGSKISMPKKLILQQIKALSKQISELTQIRDTLLEAFSSQKGGDGDDADVAGPSQKGNEEKAAEAEGEESDDGNGDDETAADSKSEEF